MEKAKRQPREPLCPGGIIQGNPILEAVLNPDRRDANIFREHEQVVTHCEHYCRETSECKKEGEKGKKEILAIFKSYNKPTVWS